MSGQICNLVYLFFDQTVPDLNKKSATLRPFYCEVLEQLFVFKQYLTFKKYFHLLLNENKGFIEKNSGN